MNIPYSENTKDICSGIGTWDCERWREKIFKRHRVLAKTLAKRYARTAKKSGYVAANVELRLTNERLQLGGTGLHAGMPDSKFIDYAAYKSKKTEKDLFDFGRRFSPQIAFELSQTIIKNAGLEYPIKPIKPNDSKEQIQQKKIAAMARVCDAKWWRRQLRNLAARKFEQECRLLGFVNRQKNVYVSEYTLWRRKEQKKRNSSLLGKLEAINEEGFSISLDDAAEASMANPVNRRNELMVRMRGFEEIAKSIDCGSVFITLTAPSKFHAVTEQGYKNIKFNGTTPNEVQTYLNSVWAKVRASWSRQGIKAFGFRVVEPHHDGTPHWHQILFIKKEEMAQAMAIFERYAIEEDREELKNDISPRFLAKDLEGISAAGYVAKYIAKNLDGHGVGEDNETGTSSIDTAQRVEAWASTWGIRQFQQIGSVSVTVWREIRRASDVIAKLDDETILEISAACEAQDWAKFVDLMGGAFVKRDAQTVRPLMILADKENRKRPAITG